MLLDNELLKLAQSSGETTIEKLLDSDQRELFEELKKRLIVLKDKNREFARLVASVSEFYNSLLDRIYPQEMGHGYSKQSVKSASFLKVKV
jgi:uncharacterized protein YdcH (DUF465 family)